MLPASPFCVVVLMSAPSFKLLFSHPAHFISLGLGSGLAPAAPGTFGSLAAWGLYALVENLLPPMLPAWWPAAFIVAAFILGVACIGKTGAALGEVDHGAIVWDEFVAVWLVLWIVPPTFSWQALAILTFRFFDILKPWPVGWVDARLKNGFGVMLDDLLAAGYTLLFLMGISWLAMNYLVGR